MEENRYINVLYKKVNRNPKWVSIENSLEAMQRLVEGGIDVIQLEGALLVCRKEKEMKELEPNILLENKLICGSFFIAGDDYENADFISLTKKQFRKFEKNFLRQKQKNNLEMECEEME